ncbi:MAG: DUF488 domain-containing protein [Sphingorhabdus sp.]|uniref:DUF488 domain-containing protein n=1 Tax=Sphingorhabdus sp. TaxID=1902408 RepID=UPI0025ED311C|nr:DUF488 domain-containing protein [Sphingorhabdus sp.]MCO4090742.1 DUF488 domain-containing protein [Sphingorhabdus sp.]
MIYTIGYSNRSLPEFLNELTSRGIAQLWDVRSSPWSRNAAFNASKIEQWSESAGIFYRQCGTIFGGRSEVALDDPIYIDLLNELIIAAKRNPVVVMCAEGDPANCHRSWAIGASLLLKCNVSVINIMRDGTTEDIGASIRRIKRRNFTPAILSALDGMEPFAWPEKNWFC